MRIILSLLAFVFLFVNQSLATIGNTNNGTSTDTIWSGPLPAINAARFVATTNETVRTIYAKIVGVTGRYKCAIYAGTAASPVTFLKGSLEVTNPVSGWTNFTLTAPVTVTNGQTYWLAIWSESSAAAVYYTAGGTLVWMDKAYGSWPTTWTVTSGNTFNYCIYAKGTVTPTPPSTNITFTLSWTAPPAPYIVRYYDIFGTTNIMIPFGWLTNVGKTTNLTWTVPKTTMLPMYFFRVVCNAYTNSTLSGTGSVTLAWDYTCGTTNDVVGYRVYYGAASRTYTSNVSVYLCTNRVATVTNLPRNVIHYFAATAFDSSGLESDFSSEVSHSWTANSNNVPPFYVPMALRSQ